MNSDEVELERARRHLAHFVLALVRRHVKPDVIEAIITTMDKNGREDDPLYEYASLVAEEIMDEDPADGKRKVH